MGPRALIERLRSRQDLQGYWIDTQSRAQTERGNGSVAGNFEWFEGTNIAEDMVVWNAATCRDAPRMNEDATIPSGAAS